VRKLSPKNIIGLIKDCKKTCQGETL